MVSERAITRTIQRHLDTLDGWWGFKVHGAGQMLNGVPDIVGCYRGRFVAIEIKRPGQRPTALQRHRLDQIASAGGVAVVATCWEDVEGVLGLEFSCPPHE